jgi:ABC-type branched-subunit amino acid transport system substrate-binding protein
MKPSLIAASVLLACAGACSGLERSDSHAAPPNAPANPAPAPALKTDKGVDLEHKTIRLGVLNDESGPAAAIGKPYAVGKRVLAAQINAGGSGILPEGWKVELVERDQGYNPQKSVQAYKEIAGDVLLIAHSFGTPNTLPLRPMLTRDTMLALPASLSSVMAQHRSTIPFGPSYELEAMRAVDFIVAQPKPSKAQARIKIAIVYQQDDYGLDGLSGLRKAAAHHGVTIASEQKITPGQRDFDDVVAALKGAGATHVVLAVLPSASAALLGTAAELKYKPTWIGNTPSWSDAFFDAAVIPAVQLANYLQVTGESYWGEALPGMPKFLAAYEKYGKAASGPDSHLLVSYMQGLIATEVIRRAIEAGDVTRAGLMAVVPQIQNFDVGGLGQPIDLRRFPYVTNTRVRVLKPDFARKSWSVVSDFSTPAAFDSADAPAAEVKTATAAPAAAPVLPIDIATAAK